MSLSAKDKVEARKRRHRRVRKRVVGTKDRLRLSVFRSNSHLYAQIIDDLAGRTIVATSTLDPAIKPRIKGNTIEAAKIVGATLAERAKAANVTTVVFDRGGYQYHGKLKALADAAREAGLSF
ncbi:MAG: 50S ribosomal protein L18 [Nitrospirae bacterium RIFCSPHIGHO2_01_FULL_66_17]|nr:MAG: 50S ribosomal protein L18 [Nitrospirae bacterium RIFCSPHIGHO2_01_FULL_66_17]